MQPETITLPLVTSELISSLWKSAPPTFDISLDLGNYSQFIVTGSNNLLPIIC